MVPHQLATYEQLGPMGHRVSNLGVRYLPIKVCAMACEMEWRRLSSSGSQKAYGTQGLLHQDSDKKVDFHKVIKCDDLCEIKANIYMLI